MYGNGGANHYKQMQVKTASSGQILIMLYEAAIRNVKKAADCLDKKDLPGKGIAITKTIDIVNELSNSLNFEVGGDIARNLERLYHFMVDQLIKANSENDKTHLAPVQKNLETLLDAWRVAVAEAAKQGAAK